MPSHLSLFRGTLGAYSISSSSIIFIILLLCASEVVLYTRGQEIVSNPVPSLDKHKASDLWRPCHHAREVSLWSYWFLFFVDLSSIREPLVLLVSSSPCKKTQMWETGLIFFLLLPQSEGLSLKSVCSHTLSSGTDARAGTVPSLEPELSTHCGIQLGQLEIGLGD